MPVVRRAIDVSGQVQGVGFRPFVFRLATDAGLRGSVCNDGAGVHIEVQGAPQTIDRLQQQLRIDAPPLARIEHIAAVAQPLRTDEPPAFRIEASRQTAVRTGVVPDACVCAACLEDMFDPANRRWRYPFTNCTHCGPRYTITARLPYDRRNTSMAGFALCDACTREYTDPSNRRFHAQPNACPRCGPRLWITTPDGAERRVADPIADALRRLQAGEIVAIKGLGGFQLTCDARNAEAVARLRRLKHREEKPFAVMVACAGSLAPLATFDALSLSLLESVERPIVLLPKTPNCDLTIRGACDGMPAVGVMLPATPLHYLLFHEAAGRPSGTTWLAQTNPWTLVATSANPGGEPLVIDNEEAFSRLAPLCDAMLLHDRDIVVRCDDSVIRSGLTPRVVRRARGWTPEPIRLARSGPSILAVGAHLKNTVCVTRGHEAFLSQHVGDLDNAATVEAMESAAAHLMRVLEVTPEAVAHDLHPDYQSTRYAARFAAAAGINMIPVQHHHAHVAAVMAERGLTGPVLGLAIDGVGLGSDGASWGGELLIVDTAGARRVGHLRELLLPGGERAAREPWRAAAGALHALGRGDEIEHRFRTPAAAVVRRMLDTRTHAPPTSSLGRHFDAAAALLGVRTHSSFEGQAPMLLEGLAARAGTCAPQESAFSLDEHGTLDLLPLLAVMADTRDACDGAALFHATLTRALARWCAAAARRERLNDVVVSGGCALNRHLCDNLRLELAGEGITLHEAAAAPPNDGGLSLGQAWAAMLSITTARTGG